ncbi:DUF1599 domain-containing protein [Flavilitoribacter nigricans]|uniref:Nucleotide modification associated domain-containing protein n=1 Tax=Flavilitoribacter nigricans (strain ATCC 23147 / DSM 23189 / NBRC 102662 / NCIMB 1420 / SS-2) TaxID=1122177 RepID=A0A2D0NG82_FLAN2|nr:DUF1599 domain-containing protein [Flavilitoribacter nigricans]PHN07495.1 hypothetical protein CRP01_05175 [Flavilitoribacter nigricans DSM 23189 = NBRC 102662]
MEQTVAQYKEVVQTCRELLLAKHRDYGSSWRILRPSSLTDQLYIKAKRIRGIEESGTNLVGDSVEGEYQGLVNYSVMALIQLALPAGASLELTEAELTEYYDRELSQSLELMLKKNHDYGEVWREMRLSSITDLILAKLLRIKQIEDNAGNTEVSEGLEANYQDIINYAIFALIRINENKVSQ